MSNYFNHEQMRLATLGDEWLPELGRELVPGNFDANTHRPEQANGPKVSQAKTETFMDSRLHGLAHCAG